MDRLEPHTAQIIPFPRGRLSRPPVVAAGTPHDPRGLTRPAADASAWYHQAALQEAAGRRRD